VAHRFGCEYVTGTRCGMPGTLEGDLPSRARIVAEAWIDTDCTRLDLSGTSAGSGPLRHTHSKAIRACISYTETVKSFLIRWTLTVEFRPYKDK
jgi:hypothetical protein